jgi:hypothetical protein
MFDLTQHESVHPLRHHRYRIHLPISAPKSTARAKPIMLRRPSRPKKVIDKIAKAATTVAAYRYFRWKNSIRAPRRHAAAARSRAISIDLDLLDDLNGIVNFYAEIANGALDLRVAQ